MDRLEIALFIPDLNTGGAERVFVNLANHFASLGHCVNLILARQEGLLLSEVATNVRITSLRVSPAIGSGILFGFLASIKLTWYLSRQPRMTVMSTLTGANIATVIANLFCYKKHKIILREASSLENVRSKLRLSFMRVLYPRADLLVVLSGYVKQQFVAKLRFDEKKIIVIGNPVNKERISYLSKSELPARFRDIGKSYVLCVGQLVDAKGFDLAIAAMSKVIKTRDVQLVVVGCGEQRQELETLGLRLGISRNLIFTGNLQNPYPLMAQCTLFLLVSKWEGFPNVLLEAMALKRNLITTKYNPCVEDILKNYPETGYRICDRRDPDELANIILEMLEFGNAIAVNRSGLEEFGIAEVGKRYLDVLALAG